jgi:hypothetical protein
VLSAVVRALQAMPDQLDEAVARLAPQADLDPELVLRAVRQVRQPPDDGGAPGR